MPWWTFKTYGKDKRAVKINECRVGAHNTENEQTNICWLWIQNHRKELEQNNRSELESHAGDTVEDLQKKINLMKEQMENQ